MFRFHLPNSSALDLVKHRVAELREPHESLAFNQRPARLCRQRHCSYCRRHVRSGWSLLARAPQGAPTSPAVLTISPQWNL